MKEQIILLRFGEHIKELRKHMGLSQEQLALLADLDRTYISGIERGKRNVSLINLLKLAKALEIPAHKIISFRLDTQNNEK